MFQLIGLATIETLIMVLSSTLIGIALAIPMAAWLTVCRPKGLAPCRPLCSGLNFVINFFRSLPYIILVVALIPLTKLLTGTYIGTLAAIVPLSIASITLMTRIAENAFNQVPKGLIEASLTMGASKLQIVRKVIIPEAMPSFVAEATTVVINLIGFSAMAGAVGGGGLGDLAIRYGYQRYNTLVMLWVIVILFAMVQAVHMIGTRTARKITH